MRNQPADMDGVQRALARSVSVARASEQRQNEWEARQVRDGGYVRNTFSLAGEGMFWGVHNPHETWNGFACPFFPLSEVERIATLVDMMNSTDESCAVIVRGDVVMIREESYGARYKTDGEKYGTDLVTEEPVATIEVDGETFYGVGAFAWCWEVR